jgi:hypothetical protein
MSLATREAQLDMGLMKCETQFHWVQLRVEPKRTWV